MTEILQALSVGFAFGWLLQKAGLSRYDRIVNVYRFRDLAVVKFLVSALVVGAVGVRGLVALGLAGPVPVPSTFLVGNFGGGLLFGVGMAASGFCPGTIAAGIGEGRLDYLVPGGLGLVAGALAFGLAYPWVFPLVAKGATIGATLPLLLGADPWLVVVLLAEAAALLFYLIERRASADRGAR
jgi:uncharacterized membrane protein YedE/YeeE